MNRTIPGCVMTLLLLLSLVGCGGGDEVVDGGSAAQPESETAKTRHLATPKDSLRRQLELLKKGAVEELKACFTERQQGRISPEAVAEGQKELAEYTFEELYASEERGEYEGRPTCKIMMENGRTLTTLVLVDGQWLADTVWFR